VRIRQAARVADDDFRSALAPGLRVSADAERVAGEIAFSAGRLAQLAADPPGLYAEVRDHDDAEEALWLGFLIAYLGPLEGDDPFSAIAAARTSWHGGELPRLDEAETGPRGAHEQARGDPTVIAYRAWAQRAGAQAAAFAGEPHWPPERRFARAFERLALPGMRRETRFDLLVSLGRLGRLDVSAGSLFFGGGDDATVAAKRVLGIGDPLLLDRRAGELAQACGVPLEALDLALFNWQRDEPRTTLGARGDTLDASVRDRAAAALGVGSGET